MQIAISWNGFPNKMESGLIRRFEFYIPFTILVSGTIIAFLTDIDIEISRYFFHPDSNLKFDTTHPLVVFGNQWGPKISMSIALLALIGLTISFANPRFIKFRAVFYFIALCYLLGPTLIVNGVLKETWNRPRPREIIEFNGNNKFVKVLIPGPREFHGKSFPSGHGSAGFVLLLFYFLFKRRSKSLAVATLLLALAFGTYLSVVRIASGAHFFSDNVWAFGICWFVAYFLYYRWYLKYIEKPKAVFKSSLKRWIILVGGIGFITSIAFLPFLLTDDYYENYQPILIPIPEGVNKIVVKGVVQKGNGHLYPADKKMNKLLVLKAEGVGRVFPGTTIHREFKLEQKGSTLILNYTSEPDGYYLSYHSHNEICIPEEIPVVWNLQVQEGLTLFRRGNYVIKNPE